jgi:hypothetical protein
MEEIANTSLFCVEPLTLVLSSDLSKEITEITADTTGMEVEDIPQNRHCGRKGGKTPEICDLQRFPADYKITTPRIGQVPEKPTRMQKKRKATFVNRAPSDGRPSWLLDGRALTATGTWPTLNKNRFNMNRSLLK